MKKVVKAFDNKDLSSLTTMMLRQYLDPNKIIPDKGVTFFHLIIGHQSENFAYKVTKLFLRYGGDPNVASDDGVTPVHVAAAWGRTRILHLLLVNGGDPWLQDDDRKNAFNYAFEEQEWDAVEMLHHFQQMHTSGGKRELPEQGPKFEMNFERVLLRKGDDMFEYTCKSDKDMKSTKTQTTLPASQEKHMKGDSLSPVLSKIKYFESHPPLSEIGWRKPDTTSIRGSKELYETSCEIMVNGGDFFMEKNKVEDIGFKVDDPGHYVSSIHIETTPPPPPPKAAEEVMTEDDSPSIIVLDKTSNHSLQGRSSGDVRSQLFMELQEAVLRRSRLRMSQSLDSRKDKNITSASVAALDVDDDQSQMIQMIENLSAPSIIEDSTEAVGKSSPVRDSFAAKDVPHLYGVNMSSNSLLRHMSDFATKVMNEIELGEGSMNGTTTNTTSSNRGVLTSTYLTCEDESDVNEGGSVERTASALQCGESLSRQSFLDTSNDSFLSVAEEYRYTDKEEGVVLMEKKLVVAPNVSDFIQVEEPEAEEDEEYKENNSDDRSSMVSTASSVPSAISYESDVLRRELTIFGYMPGPITKTTKKLYLKKLWKLRKGTTKLETPVRKAYSAELEMTLSNANSFGRILTYSRFEDEMMASFEARPNRKWREGLSKTSFNYLLLDPRLSLNLPRRAASMVDLDIWNCFLSSIFYVGKGKRARPYAHLYEAVSSWQKRRSGATSCSEKMRTILDIWSDDLGVICLHVFHNTIPVEAYTREAAMIDAVGVTNLQNCRCGKYYGAAATWTAKDKQRFGVYLLYKAMLIYLNEGERQIRPCDVA